jgi:hypothetical protein
MMSVIGLAFLPMARFWQGLFSNCSHCSLLKAIRPELFPDKVQAGPGVPPSSLFFSEGCACEVLFFFFQRGPTPPQCPVSHFPQPGLPEDTVECPFLPQM